MDTAVNTDEVRFCFFQDHSDQPALSVTFPITVKILAKAPSHYQSQSGNLESYTSYPCIQVYLADPSTVLDTERGQREIKQWILQILSDLEKKHFFTLLKGIRFEIYSGRPHFRQYLESGRSNHECIEAIEKHSISERENRNALTCFRAAVQAYKVMRSNHAQRRSEHPDRNELLDMLNQEREALKSIRRIGELISTDFLHFNTWTCSLQREHQPQNSTTKAASCTNKDKECSSLGSRGCRRSSTMSSSKYRSGFMMDLSPLRQRSSSTGDLKMSRSNNLCGRGVRDTHASSTTARSGSVVCEVPKMADYMLRRIETLVHLAAKKFYAPIIPASFYSPPVQLYHSVVLVRSRNETQDQMHILRFGRGFSIDEMTDDQFPATSSPKLQCVSIGPKSNKSASLAKVLIQHLHLLDMTSSLTAPHRTPAEVDDMTTAWFGSSSLDLEKHMLDEEFGDYDRYESTDESATMSIGSGPHTPEQYQESDIDTKMVEDMKDAMVIQDSDEDVEMDISP